MDSSGMRQGSTAGRCEPGVEYQMYTESVEFLDNCISCTE